MLQVRMLEKPGDDYLFKVHTTECPLKPRAEKCTVTNDRFRGASHLANLVLPKTCLVTFITVTRHLPQLELFESYVVYKSAT